MPQQRSDAIREWSQYPHALVFASLNDPGIYNAFLATGTLDDSWRERTRDNIIRDREAMPDAPAFAWDGRRVLPGIYLSGSYEYRVQTARSGSESVVGRRVVGYRARNSGGSWTSVGFITRSGRFRLWNSYRYAVGSDWIIQAEQIFQGSDTPAPDERLCWLCRFTVGATGDCASSGLCAGHLSGMPANQEDEDEYDDGYNDGDYNDYHDNVALSGYVGTSPRPRPLIDSAPVSLVRAERSEVYADYWQ